MAQLLPPEIWLQIFSYAADDDSLFDHALPTSLWDSAWTRMLYGNLWYLRSPDEVLNTKQRQSYFTKKAISATCRAWRTLGAEFLFRFLYFNDPSYLQQFGPILNNNPNYGRWVKRIHITRYYAGLGATMYEMQKSLGSIIRHCPNLEIFVVSWPLSHSFSAVAYALRHRSKTLHTLSLNVPTASLGKAIVMLQTLPSLKSLHLEFEGSCPEDIELGASSDLEIALNDLQQLSLRGPCGDFVEQAIGWKMPSLQSLSLDFLSYRNDLPDIVDFLAHHGAHLTFLDINCIPDLDVPTILDLCPLLTTFAFNLDWRIESAHTDIWGAGTLVHRPHANITTIGCHQLLHAFGVGDAAKYAAADPFTTHVVRRRNDANFAAITRAAFPRLARVRVLNRTLLRDLERADGPARDCYERWERWWDQCAAQGVRLEDCTGAPLGTLPMDDPEDEEVESEVDEDAEEQKKLQPLRDLLEECKRMSLTREEPLFALPPPYRQPLTG
ncbi:hypothetical protein WOLCODRAFT_94220 [Wolfiporia cocos MD-104 SS10]|uniref:F-box domain-containing protein n=1 Tax=Wolfiporia cocos (strain MD-104) TaxID=742152 RepID=A0A2H3J4Y9_WOLCO|nr:hypothetical protein WOLCODRAFT_94220 [Wolfiporia cocos MD-104 SS10]